jgi:hypothetical protein
MNPLEDSQWRDALQGLMQGDFSHLEPLFTPDFTPTGERCCIIKWYEQGAFELFAGRPSILTTASPDLSIVHLCVWMIDIHGFFHSGKKLLREEKMRLFWHNKSYGSQRHLSSTCQARARKGWLGDYG